jgi:hypothetical protein
MAATAPPMPADRAEAPDARGGPGGRPAGGTRRSTTDHDSAQEARSMTARRHNLLAAALALPLLLGLVACGGDDDDDAATADAADTTEADDGTTETTEAEADAADDPAADGDAAGEAVATVFDSSVAFDDKVALIEEGESHRTDHEAYVGAAERVGGITVEPTDVAADGDTATVTYRVLFAGTEAYADLSMDVTRVDDAWVVPSDAFCGFLASARTPCAGDAGAGGAPTETTVGG